MIGLDTNILLRYLVQDGGPQAAQARKIFETLLNADNPGFISIVAMTETVWVLSRVYHQTGQEIACVVERILQSGSLVVEHHRQVFAAMIALKEGRGSFADALIAELGIRAGCAYTLTFDYGALQIEGFNFHDAVASGSSSVRAKPL